VVRFFSKDEIDSLLDRHVVRGRHIPLAIADHEAGRQLPLDLIRVVAEMGRPLST
jgi:hypothetical protein